MPVWQSEMQSGKMSIAATSVWWLIARMFLRIGWREIWQQENKLLKILITISSTWKINLVWKFCLFWSKLFWRLRWCWYEQIADCTLYKLKLFQFFNLFEIGFLNLVERWPYFRSYILLCYILYTCIAQPVHSTCLITCWFACPSAF